MEPMKLPGAKARAIIERDEKVISPSYPRGYPFVMDHGKGCEVWDVDGNRFLDFAAGIAEDTQSELETAETLHKEELDIDRRIDDIIKHTAITKNAPSIP